MPRFGRVLLKLSGEMLGGPDGHGLDQAAISRIAAEIASAAGNGVQIAVVPGAGNLCRGAGPNPSRLTVSRQKLDAMGMLATTINCIALADALEQAGIPAVHMTSLAGIPESIPFRHDLANKLLADGTVLVISGGTGLPFFSTDTAACVRGLQIGAAVVLKATQVDGVYDRDPRQRGARRLAKVSFERALRDRLAFMDQPALALAAEHGLPVLVFQGHGKGALAAGLMGRAKGSLVGNEQE